MVTIREASQEDSTKVVAFYRETEYLAPLSHVDRVLIAESDEGIIGALRLCRESEVLVLRGMRVLQGMRRRQIGTNLLSAASDILAEDTCYCIPHDYLEAFYRQVGFRKLPLPSAPAFLQDRWREYGRRGLNVIIMRRDCPEARRRGLI
jgi:N-acetylglutamate synthase-like GNAT family acetyltransferase